MAKSKSSSPVKKKVFKMVPAKAAPRLTARVAKLETQVKALRVTAPTKTSSSTAPILGPTAESRPLTFSLGPNAPAFVQVTLDQTEKLVLGTSPVSSKPKFKNVPISMLIDLLGNAGQTAKITITNVNNSPMTATIPPGRSDWSESRGLIPTW